MYFPAGAGFNNLESNPDRVVKKITLVGKILLLNSVLGKIVIYQLYLNFHKALLVVLVDTLFKLSGVV